MEFGKQYLTYNEYKELGGTLDKTPFNLLEFRARKLIDERTSNRLVNLDSQIEEVKLCVFELIHQIQIYTDNNNKSSESVGNYSVSYNNVQTKEQTNLYLDIIKSYLINCTLDNIPYLYIGADNAY